MAYEITEDVIKDIRKHASRGLTKKQIAAAMGWAESTIYKKINENIDVSKAIKEGAASGIKQVANALFQNATDHNNTTAQIFFLKNRAPDEWKDRVPEITHHVAPPTRIEIVTVDGRKES